MAVHVMIDLETLALGHDAIVPAIGACVFDPLTGEIGDTFFSLVSIESAADNGFKMDCDTVRWWTEQSEEVQKQWLGTESVRVVFYDFWRWLTGLCLPDDLVVWGNGPSFDLVKVAHHFEVLGFDEGWKFRNERCVRTMVAIGKLKGVDPKKSMVFEGDKHNALADAIHQAKYVSVIYQHLNNLELPKQGVA